MNKTIKNKKMKTISDSSTITTLQQQNKKPLSISTVSQSISSSSNSSIKSANTRIKNFNLKKKLKNLFKKTTKAKTETKKKATSKKVTQKKVKLEIEGTKTKKIRKKPVLIVEDIEDIEDIKAIEEETVVPKSNIKLSQEEPVSIPLSLQKINMKIADQTSNGEKNITIVDEGADVKVSLPHRYNEEFIDILEQLYNIMMSQGEIHRARAYKKAEETVVNYLEDITNVEQLKGKPGIGATIMEKFKEYVETGTLKVIEREKNNPVNIFTQIYGVGPKKAKELVEKGITTIQQLKENQIELLNDKQIIGLKYYEDIQKRIPRSEIDKYAVYFNNAFDYAVDSVGVGSVDGAKFEIVGSYRRGAQSSGDIDVIITSKNKGVFDKFIDRLLEEKVIVEVLSRGPTKSLVITQLPGMEFRRVDFLYSTEKEYPFAVLYFTGSKYFNTAMRHVALQKGYTMNEHGMYKFEDKKKGGLVDHDFKDEKDIFDFLGLQYKTPVERIDGRSVVGFDVGIGSVSDVLMHNSNKKIADEVGDMGDVGDVSVFEMKKLEPKKITIEGEVNLTEKKLVPKKKTQKNQSKKLINEVVENVGKTVDNDFVMDVVEKFKKNGISVVESLSEKQLQDVLDYTNNAYRNMEPIMTDNEYDIIHDYMEMKYPNNPILKDIGAPITVEKNKAVLPYSMGSMDKRKPDTNELENWKQKYKGSYVLSCKLDGVSGLYVTEGEKPKLYTRGDGKIGQDVSHFIPYLRLPKEKGLAIRGEFIIPKNIFELKYKGKFANARNLVSGIINRISVDEKIKDVHFVAYEFIKPEYKPYEQMERLTKMDIDVVLFTREKDVTNEMLSNYLIEWRNTYDYEIDGVIVTDDKIYPRKTGNPEHSFAFKMVLSDQIAESRVIDVIWTPSKDGYLKPRVRIEPIKLGGVEINYATGFNGAFIEQNKIGIGAVIEIIRSGDVIPHIKSVTHPAEKAKMPDESYKWNDTHIDIILENVENDPTVREKNITGFFKGIGVDGLKSGNVDRIISAGYDSVPKIIKMSVDDFLKVEGFKGKLANKIHDSIQTKLKEATLINLMASSNIFGRGISEKKIEPIMEMYPNILNEVGSNTSNDDLNKKIEMVKKVKGIAEKTAELFVSKIGMFVGFLNECGLEYKLGAEGDGKAEVDVDINHPLYGKTVVFTGFRNDNLEKIIKNLGGKIGSSVSKNTFVVVTKDKDDKTGKVLQAEKVGVTVMEPNEFKTAFNLTE
jgi:NAD-dependent DNA ligase